MQTIHAAQEAFRLAGAVDLDEDGRGEYGTFRELSAATGLRGHADDRRLDPPLLAPSFRSPGNPITVDRSGYRFQLYLPTVDGGWVCADQDARAVDPDAAETRWVAFAWPLRRNARTVRTFRVDETGTVMSTTRTEHPSTLPRAKHVEWVVVR